MKNTVQNSIKWQIPLEKRARIVCSMVGNAGGTNQMGLGMKERAAEPASGAASDVDVAAFSISTKYVWVCFLKEHKGIFLISSVNICWAGQLIKCLQYDF